MSWSLLKLSRLADLHIVSWPLHATVDLDLPPSLTQLKLGNYRVVHPDDGGSKSVDFFWALREAAKCIGHGAHLYKLSCIYAVASLQPVQWGASLEEQHRWLGGQFHNLRELEVWGATGAAAQRIGCSRKLSAQPGPP